MVQRDYTQKMIDVAQVGYNFSIGAVIEESWGLVKKNLGLHIGFTLIFMITAGIISQIEYVGPFINLLINPLLTAGIVIVGYRTDHNQEVEFSHFFEGFQKFSALWPTFIISYIFTIIGLFLLVIPGIYLAVCYALVIPMLLFHQTHGSITDNLELLRKAISKNWFLLFSFFLVVILINILGLLVCGVGLLFSYPVTLMSTYVLFKHIFGLPVEMNIDKEFHEIAND
jgi:uncharacterized membrane protein